MKTIPFYSALVVFLAVTTGSFASPMIPYGPMTIEGTIQEITWVPEKSEKGEPGMSGSLGIDRTFPACYIIILTNTVIDNSKIKDDPYRLSYKSGEMLRVSIRHKKNDGFLKKGMRIRVVDYEVNGDEGGVWSSFDRVEIVQ